jgi:hypothetical protein
MSKTLIWRKPIKMDIIYIYKDKSNNNKQDDINNGSISNCTITIIIGFYNKDMDCFHWL